MTSLVGTVSPFDNASQLWDEYIEMLEYFFQANGIDSAEKKKAVLLSGVGASTYSLLRSLICPEKPGDKTYEELVTVLKTHYNPKPSEIVPRIKFNSRTRKNGETVADFVAELKKLAQHCEYGSTLPQMLRDILVCGVNDDRMQRRLLSEVELTFEKALTICQAMESANKNVRDLQGLLMEDTAQTMKSFKGPAAVHRVYTFEKKGRQKDTVCYRCKGQHAPEECKFLNELCHKCGKRGHIKRACRAKQAAGGGGRGSKHSI
nr:uncharacterized protein LOC110438662 [Danio rerio]XP_021332015.1 uncharacterized protein LOC110438662 [Danio rerio]|eukprot:XP_021327326.1 uncharacterized protein LOC110438662 [Danio rerio]